MCREPALSDIEEQSDERESNGNLLCGSSYLDCVCHRAAFLANLLQRGFQHVERFVHL